MPRRRRLLFSAAILPALCSAAAWAQAHRTWTDPPAETRSSPDDEPGATSGSVSPVARPRAPAASSSATGREETDRRADTAPPGSPAVPEPRPNLAVNGTPEQAARRLVTAYFEAWSSPNARALEAMPDFYGSRVIFHGRSMSLRALMDEKRRFVRRWPDRTYRLRPDTLTVACEPSGQSCTVRSLFSFDADSPSRSRRSTGTGTVEFVVDLSGGRPVIASETSLVQDRRAQANQRSIE